MKVVLACYGTRGDVEPCVALGRELLRRGHDVRIAVTPGLVGFAEAAGLAAVPFGPDFQSFNDTQRKLLPAKDFRILLNIPRLIRLSFQAQALLTQTWRQTSATLLPLVEGADLLVNHQHLEESALNIAEYYGIPLATVHVTPRRANRQMRSANALNEWRHYRGMFKKIDNEQRRELGLPKATTPSGWRITKRGSLEIQAYDEAGFPGLAAEWAKFDGQRPFVGTLTLALETEADDAVVSWIAGGTPPIYFGFGGTPVESPADTIAMIAAACERLGERALVCAASSDFSNVPQFEHVKVVSEMSFEAIFPLCRALVHQGGSSTTPIGLRAGVPTLILWTWSDQALWGTQITRLKAGAARPFSTATVESLIADLRQILAPEYAARAREISTRMTKPTESVANAADQLEKFVRPGRFRRIEPGVVTGPAEQIGTAARPVILFVLGMPRSGTSALTRVLSLCGGVLPAELGHADSDNPLGYWEPRATQYLHGAILRDHGSSDADPSLRLQQEGAFDAAEKARYIARMRAYLNTLPTAPLVIIKDLCIPWLGEMWFEAARLAGFDIVAVLAVRHPHEAIASLAAKRRISLELSNALWLKYTLLAERITRGVPRVFVEYANLLEDWRRETKRISDAVSVDLETGDEGAVGEFLKSDLHHQRHHGPVAEPFGTDWISSVHEALGAAARDEPWDASVLDRVFESYGASERVFQTAFEDFREDFRNNFSFSSIALRTLKDSVAFNDFRDDFRNNFSAAVRQLLKGSASSNRNALTSKRR